MMMRAGASGAHTNERSRALQRKIRMRGKAMERAREQAKKAQHASFSLLADENPTVKMSCD